MRGLQKSKRVSWASNGNLCQVKIFRSEEDHCIVGLGIQKNLQPKKSAIRYTKGSVGKPDDGLPPGFDGVYSRTQLLKNKLAQIPLAKWNCPSKIMLDPFWRVAVGEESEEVNTENERHSRLFEAVYPRCSSIPPNPFVSPDASTPEIDDSRTPLIPSTDIEELEDASEDVARAQPQLPAATSAALSAMLSSNVELAKLIDQELLVKILTNHATLDQLVKLQGNPFIFQPKPSLVMPINSNDSNKPLTYPNHPKQQEAKPSLVMPINSNDSNKPLTYPDHQKQQETIPVIKDMNYYKSLIQQHGSEKPKDPIHPQFITHHGGSNPNLTIVGNYKHTNESKPKFNKPCVYFKSSKGCRRGANCPYQHDSPLLKRAIISVPEMQPVKRMKMDRGYTCSQICS